MDRPSTASPTECFVTLQRLESETVEHTDGNGQSGRRVPLNIDDNAPYLTPTPRTKIKLDEEGNEEAFIDGNWYQHVTPYDGQPKPYDTY